MSSAHDDKDKKNVRKALILYGSETGNAQEVAEELSRIAERLHFVTHVVEFNDIQAEALASHTLTVFVVSTTGQGDFPVNARAFWKTLLLKRLPATYLNGVNFTSFGLGDSSYPKFNWASRKLRKRLVQLGANEIYPFGEADQQHPEGLEGTFIPWTVDLRRYLLDKYPLPASQPPIPDNVQLPPKWILQELDSSSIASPQGQRGRNQNDQSNLVGIGLVGHDTRPLPGTITATLTQNKRITPQEHWQDVRHICLTTPDTVSYTPGDMISITPKSFAADVDMLIALMNWNDVADKPVMFVPGVGLRGKDSKELPPAPIPYLASYPSFSSSSPHLTLRILLTDYLDIRAIPRRSFFASIAHYTTDTMHKERLLEFTNPELVDEFWDYTTRPRRSILEVLHEFESVKIPWQHAASVLPVLRGRQFSLASGGELKHATASGTGTKFELLIAIVKYQTIIKKIREGVCTRYLAVLRPGSTLKVHLQRGGLNPTLQQLVGPSVLIGPGTGLAPLRAMIWEKASSIKAYREKHLDGQLPAVGATVLVFGGRNRTADYFFEEEWKQFIDSGLIKLQVLTAFSRDQQGPGQKKIYVQERIREKASLIFDLLHEQSGAVFICGSSGRMPQAVREALIECFQQPTDSSASASETVAGRTTAYYTRAQAEQYLIDMEKVGRYKQETW